MRDASPDDLVAESERLRTRVSQLESELASHTGTGSASEEAVDGATTSAQALQLERRVLPAATPREALQIASRHDGDIDILLADVVLPGMTGPALVRQVEKIRPATRSVYMSGDPADSRPKLVEALASGRYLSQPFEPRLLTEMLTRVVDPAQHS